MCRIWSSHSFFKALSLGFFALVFCNPLTIEARQTKTDEQTDTKKGSSVSNEEALLDQAAVGSQNKGNFKEAAGLWSNLLKKYPQSTLRNKALHQLGLCEASLGQFAEAADHLKEAIVGTNPNEVETLARAQLFLGFSRLKLGESALEQGKPDDANRWLTSAAESLRVVTDKYPKFEGAHEAAYFQGSALEQLGQTEEALSAYAKVLTYENPKFKPDALYALGDLSSRQKKLVAAVDYFREYLKIGADLPAANEVRMRAANSMWQIALEAKAGGDNDRFNQSAKEAKQIFETLAQTDFPKRDEARFNLALLQFQTGEPQLSTQNFEMVANGNDKRLMGIAATNLGRQYLDQQDLEQAMRWLQKAIDAQDANSPTAAHWLARTLLKKGDYVGAFSLAETWAGKSPDDSVKFDLLLDKADAAFADKPRQLEAQKLYLELSKVDWVKAPVALYNAAYAALTLGDHDQAIALAEQFAKQFQKHDFLPDAIEVLAESLVAKSDFAAAQKKFFQLVSEFPTNAKNHLWHVRAGMSSFFAGDYAKTIESLSPVAVTFIDKNLQAEAWHWVGAAYAKNKEASKSVEAFQKSLQAGPWSRQSETWLALAEAQIAVDDWANAEKSIEKLAADFPKSPQAPRGFYLLANHYKASGNNAKADETYLRLSKMESAGAFGPYAAMKRGWLKVDEKNWAAAKTEFEQAIAAAGDDLVLLNKSRVGLATAQRNAGNSSVAIDLLKLVLKESKDERVNIDAAYELGLAEAAAGNWQGACEQFASLLNRDQSSEIQPSVRYEYAWALQNSGQKDKALEQFQWLAANAANTAIGADAIFQIGEAKYSSGDFKSAIENFKLCLPSAPPALQEKAYYRMGWSHFKLNNFAESRDQFAKQTESFAQGPLYADGLYMLSEVLFKQKEFQKAYESYRVARPVMEASKSIDPVNLWLSKLHAAQSANQLKKFDEARDEATALINDSTANELLRLDAQLELGIAYLGLNDFDKAMKAWSAAAIDTGKTGIHARCMLGSALFAKQKLDEAILEFSLAQNGYGGEEVDEEIDPWQAFATYELARCKHVQAVNSKSDAEKMQLTKESVAYFQELVDKYPQDRLAIEAKKEIEKLEKSIKPPR